jgi:hypothetical protein
MLIVLGPLGIFLMALFFFIGRAMARARGRDGLVWGIVCALTTIFGVIALALVGSAGREVDAAAAEGLGQLQSHGPDLELQPDHGGPPAGWPAQPPSHAPAASHMAPPQHAQSQPPPYRNGALAGAQPSHGPDAATRWAFLQEYDPVVREAIEALAPLGPDALEELRAAYFMIEDRAMIPLIKARILEKRRAPPPPVQLGNAAEAARSYGEPPRQQAGAARTQPASGYAGMKREAPRPADTQPPQLPLQQPETAQRDLASPPLYASGPFPGQGTDRRYNPAAAAAAGRSTPAGEAGPGSYLNGGGAQPSSTPPIDPARQQSGPPPLSGASSYGPPGRGQARNTAVTESDLVGAEFLETYRGIHLFRLLDGRVYVDRYLAVFSHEQARQAIDHIEAHRPV